MCLIMKIPTVQNRIQKKRRQGRKAKDTDTTFAEEEMKSEQEVDKIPDAAVVEKLDTDEKTKQEEKPAEKKNEIDIASVPAHEAEIGVRKVAAEVGVAMQTENKWKKDEEKAAAEFEEATKELPASADKEEEVIQYMIHVITTRYKGTKRNRCFITGGNGRGKSRKSIIS